MSDRAPADGLHVDFDRLRQRHPFPDPSEATPEGLLAYGGDLSPGRLVSAYASGVFPWYSSGPILWFSPDPRMVLLPERLHVGRSLRRTLAREPFALSMDTAFEPVIRACAEQPRPGQDGTWITEEMIGAYVDLHRLGLAHSVEAWRDGELVGGLYGVSLGRAFFGESMFARAGDASKVAFVRFVRQLEAWEFTLIDCQVHTAHLERFGAEMWPRPRFLGALARALEGPTRPGPWSFDAADQPPGASDFSNHSTSQ
jgi:leucyl/phenylalanyl-tRNA--protein transferase